jgi:hypothetical protein
VGTGFRQRNLIFAFRCCNVLCANTLPRAGIGRKTRQYNPGNSGATSLGHWPTAVTSMKGESSDMAVQGRRRDDPRHTAGDAEPICHGNLETEVSARGGPARGRRSDVAQPACSALNLGLATVIILLIR